MLREESPSRTELEFTRARSTVACPTPSGLAARLLGEPSRRLTHSARVARQAAQTTELLTEPWKSSIEAAAWLHDIGYAEGLVETGFHPLDGARWLRDQGWPDEVCQLVAWHTSALAEARLRGLDQELEEQFDRPAPLAVAALTWADLTSSPRGDVWSPTRRVADILKRYSSSTVEHRAMVAALPTLQAAVAEVEALLAETTR